VINTQITGKLHRHFWQQNQEDPFSRARGRFTVASVQLTGAADEDDKAATIECEGVAWDVGAV
jgi:hypothetical protein